MSNIRLVVGEYSGGNAALTRQRVDELYTELSEFNLPTYSLTDLDHRTLLRSHDHIVIAGSGVERLVKDAHQEGIKVVSHVDLLPDRSNGWHSQLTIYTDFNRLINYIQQRAEITAQTTEEKHSIFYKILH